MPSMRALFGGSGRTETPVSRPEPFPAADALMEMSSALVFGLQAADRQLELAGHADRVAALADRMAVARGVAEPLRAVLRQAALLHELGMIAVPAELLQRTEPLTDAELERVHAQAEFGAAIAAATCGELAATIIRHQYHDEPSLRQAVGEGTDAFQLTMILRAADVADVMSRGRAGGASDQALRLVNRAAASLVPDAATIEAYVEATAA